LDGLGWERLCYKFIDFKDDADPSKEDKEEDLANKKWANIFLEDYVQYEEPKCDLYMLKDGLAYFHLPRLQVFGALMEYGVILLLLKKRLKPKYSIRAQYYKTFYVCNKLECLSQASYSSLA